MAREKIVYVDFRRGRKPTAGGFGGGPQLLFAVFAAVLVVELLIVAAAYPSAISSFFFGPTVIAVAVACTLGARRLIARMQVARLYRRTMTSQRRDDQADDQQGRTLH